jgi:ABC transporter related protein
MCFDEKNTIIDVRNVSKRYELYRKPIHRLYQTVCMGKKQFFREFWALKNINFQVRQGESIGVIGKNGAGKSTLLQILVGTLRQTTGEIHIHGKTAALLELGCGFNPTFSGRKNVYMNGMLQGFSKKQIDARFQEIEEFADIGSFIDEPVEKYSSGMKVRLAFAVQIMSEPDIMIVDEALAVGDAAFQRKCYAKLEENLNRGMTLFLVTHSTGLVKQYCDRVIYLKNGLCVFDGDPIEGEKLYMQDIFPPDSKKKEKQTSSLKQTVQGKTLTKQTEKPQTDQQFIYEKTLSLEAAAYGVNFGQITKVRVFGLTAPNILPLRDKIRIETECSWSQELIQDILKQEGVLPNIIVGYCFANQKNISVFGINTLTEGMRINPFERTSAKISFEIELPEMANGNYFLTVAMQLGSLDSQITLNWNDFVMEFVVQNSHRFGGSINPVTKVTVE